MCSASSTIARLATVLLVLVTVSCDSGDSGSDRDEAQTPSSPLSLDDDDGVLLALNGTYTIAEARVDGETLSLSNDVLTFVLEGEHGEFSGEEGRCVGAAGRMEVAGGQLVWTTDGSIGGEGCESVSPITSAVQSIVWNLIDFEIEDNDLVLSDENAIIRFERAHLGAET